MIKKETQGKRCEAVCFGCCTSAPNWEIEPNNRHSKLYSISLYKRNILEAVYFHRNCCGTQLNVWVSLLFLHIMSHKSFLPTFYGRGEKRKKGITLSHEPRDTFICCAIVFRIGTYYIIIIYMIPSIIMNWNWRITKLFNYIFINLWQMEW